MITDVSYNTILRRIVRCLGLFVLVIGVIFRITMPWAMGEPLYLDINDGYVFGVTLLILLYIEGVKLLFKKYINKK